MTLVECGSESAWNERNETNEWNEEEEEEGEEEEEEEEEWGVDWDRWRNENKKERQEGRKAKGERSRGGISAPYISRADELGIVKNRHVPLCILCITQLK
jgi:hypothetical protein